TIAKVGYGAGTADLKGQANMLRVLIGDAPTDSAIAQDVVTVLESNLDDQNPESTAAAIGLLMDAGALDAFQTPCMMKKGRCGVVVTVLCEPDKTDQMRDILFRHTTTIGVRLHQMQREKLRRESVTVKTAYGPIKGKVVQLPDGEKRFSVEYESAKKASSPDGPTIDEIRLAAVRAYEV
ncbi:MAG: nickel insertion protein, partial [Planctomycetota bacterium]